MTARQFRFGVQSRGLPDAQEWVAYARKIESQGYSVLAIPDHTGPQLAPVPALAVAATATRTLRISPFILNNDFRQPAILAKEIATLDVLSGGRAECGLGAGWRTADYTETGIPHDPAGVRVARLSESVAIVKGLLGSDRFSFQGRYFTVEPAEGWPAPVQRPRPPLAVAGGSPRVLHLAGAEADIAAINVPLGSGGFGQSERATGTAEATARRIRWVREGAGQRFDEIELNALIWRFVVDDDRAAAARGLASELGLDVEQVLESPHLLVGSRQQIADDLRRRRDRYGFSYYMSMSSGGDHDAFADVVSELTGT